MGIALTPTFCLFSYLFIWPEDIIEITWVCSLSNFNVYVYFTDEFKPDFVLSKIKYNLFSTLFRCSRL